MFNLKDIEVQNIDRLGIVAGIIDSIGLVEIINDLLGNDVAEKVSSGHVVKAMILNGLGFVSSPLYIFSKFFETKACEHLIGEGVKAEYFNDGKLGRTLDKLFSSGLTTISTKESSRHHSQTLATVVALLELKLNQKVIPRSCSNSTKGDQILSLISLYSQQTLKLWH